MESKPIDEMTFAEIRKLTDTLADSHHELGSVRATLAVNCQPARSLRQLGIEFDEKLSTYKNLIAILEKLLNLAVAPDASEWTKEPPNESGEYWHWNGDIDCAPVPMFVGWSGSTGKCFVSMGQLGLTHAIDCEEYGGWWKRMKAPVVPVE